MNGWTASNAILRQRIIELNNDNADIISINETHLNNNLDEQPTLQGYKWYGHCRRSQHAQANRRHGGVGMFIKESCLLYHNVSIIDRDVDGILGILFQHKVSNFQFIVFSCYLPPENSPWGRDATAFFNHLLGQIYFHNYVDSVFICTDINGRTGGLSDFVPSVDRDISPRVYMDLIKNKHGECFTEFLLESKLSIVNGRITPEFDSFTS